jgi:5-methyltetrahydrofolate--homocysteine methyltransferase
LDSSFGKDFSASELAGRLDWDAFTRAWKTPSEAAGNLIDDAKKRLAEANFTISSRGGIFPAERLDCNTFKVSTCHHAKLREDGVGDYAVITFPRAQTGDCHSLADFIGDWLGMFVVSAKVPETPGDDYVSLLDSTLANFLADAAASALFDWISTYFWGWRKESDPPSGIAPAPGYPVLPDHSLKREIFHLLDLFPIQDKFVELTSNFMMSPPSSTCAFVIPDPRADYRALGPIGDDQIAALAAARGFSVERMKVLLSQSTFPAK